MHSPPLLLLDEPDTALDQQGKELVETLVKEHSEQGATTLFTTHNLDRALELSDTIAILESGRIKQGS